MFTKKQMLAARPKVKKFHTDDWGDVYVRKLDGHGLDRIEAIGVKAKEAENETNGQAYGVSRQLCESCIIFVCDDSGVPSFCDSDIDELRKVPIATLNQCQDAGLEFNNLTEQAKERVKDNLKKSRRGGRG